jgi:hypothetical protein
LGGWGGGGGGGGGVGMGVGGGRAPAAARAVMEVVRRRVPGARLVSAAGAEVVARLPREGGEGLAQVGGGDAWAWLC